MKNHRTNAPTVGGDPLVGQTVGEYAILESLGAGASGSIYGARHADGQRVALKLLRPEIAPTAADLARCAEEARKASATGHRGIVDLISFGTLPDGQHYFVSEWLLGESLQRHLGGRPMPSLEAVRLLGEIFDALAAAHAAGVVHRNLTPGNIFCVRSPNGDRYPKLVDFGIARRVPKPSDVKASRFTWNGLGTPEYVAPEQVQGQAMGAYTDIYSAGIVAFQMLTGHVPFVAPSAGEVVARQVRDTPPRISSEVDGVPPELDDLVDRMLKKRISERPWSAAEVRTHLRAIEKKLSATAMKLTRSSVMEAAEAGQTVVRPGQSSTEVVGGRYRVLEKLAEGGMGEVFKAEHVELGKLLALKVMRPEFGSDPAFVERFKREAVAASRIGQENIVDVSDFGRMQDGRFYFVMEYLDGDTLTNVVRGAGALSCVRTLQIVAQICRALKAAHGQGIIHRDLKPDNVIVLQREGKPDFVKIVDFGVAKVAEPGRSGQTSVGLIIGTPQYMSPEQASGLTLDERSDIYSLGLMAYEMISGRPPFAGATPSLIMAAHINTPTPALVPAPMVGPVPETLCVLVERMLAKSPEDRPASVAEVMSAVDGCLVELGESPVSGQAVLVEAAPRSKDSKPITKALRRSRRIWPRRVALALALILACAGVAAVASMRRDPPGGLVALVSAPSAVASADGAPVSPAKSERSSKTVAPKGQAGALKKGRVAPKPSADPAKHAAGIPSHP